MADFEGEGSVKNYEQHMKCPKCKKLTVYYTGSSVEHGNPYTAASDTEVTHYYECDSCGHRFEKWA